MIVEVTEEHIRRGRRRCLTICPIALALEDAGIKYPCVLNKSVDYSNGTFKLPENAQQFIEDFDSGKPVKPMRIRIPIKEK